MGDVKSFRGNFGSENSGQTNDGPLFERASSYQVTRLRELVWPGPWTGKSGRGQPNGRQAFCEPGQWSGDLGARQVAGGFKGSAQRLGELTTLGRRRAGGCDGPEDDDEA